MKTLDAPELARHRVASVLSGSPLPIAEWPPGSGMNVFSSSCPSRTVLDHITSKWGVLIIVALSDGSLRWGELRRTIDGISEKMLAQTLRVLENDGLVLRTVQGTIPPRVDYQLTALGHDLCGALIPLLQWVGSHAGQILTSASASASASAQAQAPVSSLDALAGAQSVVTA